MENWLKFWYVRKMDQRVMRQAMFLNDKVVTHLKIKMLNVINNPLRTTKCLRQHTNTFFLTQNQIVIVFDKYKLKTQHVCNKLETTDTTLARRIGTNDETIQNGTWQTR